MKGAVLPKLFSIGRKLEGTPVLPYLKKSYFLSIKLISFIKRRRSRLYYDYPSLQRYTGPDFENNLNITSIQNQIYDKLTTDWWTKNWKRKKAVFMEPGFAQPQILTAGQKDDYYIFYEYRGRNNKWHIAMTSSPEVTGPYDIHHFPILSPENNEQVPDSKHVADPSVIYLPNRDPPWHMWYDMCDKNDVWRIGHATSYNGKKWDKEEKNGQTKIILDVGKQGQWDDEMLHAPEVFRYDDELRMLYNAQGTGHTGFNGGLALQEETNNEFEFKKFGQVTGDDLTDIGTENRIKPPIRIGDKLYTLIGWDGAGTSTVIVSDDGGKSWETVVKFPFHMIHSFLIDEDVIYGIGSDKHIIYKPIR